MAGIYIHIPFCRHKCNYCNFYSVASTRYMDRMSEAISSELQQRKSYLVQQNIETIYFGGGTPSILSFSDIECILKAIYRFYQVSADSEITLEANPDDISAGNLKAWKAAGVNRLSIGIQSFRQEDLDFLSRTHTSMQVTQCIAEAKLAGFSNLSIDLIYGIPTLSNEGWQHNLHKAFDFGIPHISAYSLTVEERTPLEFMIRKGKMKPVDEDLSATHYEILCSTMQKYGYEHYEVSNFCLPDSYSRHNTAYWQGKHYLGAGPSAHSFNGISRSWNVSNLARYLDSVKSGIVESEQEVLSPVKQFNEYIMTSLRTMWGCDLLFVKDNFGSEWAENLLSNSLPFIEAKQMEYKAGKLLLTPEGLIFADGIAATLFIEED